jgi:rfaE bifunctional protein nucleotidyltransferase chain/domain
MSNSGHNDLINSKIFNLQDLENQVENWKAEDRKIVFTNGCFDILHRGHIDYLSRAADLGDKLIVGLNTDSSVRLQNKGDNRPIQDEDSRAFILSALESVSAVVLFSEETPINLIESVLPNILVKGGDYVVEEIVGYKEVTDNGGQVVLIPFVDGYSTSLIEKKIKGQ